MVSKTPRKAVGGIPFWVAPREEETERVPTMSLNPLSGIPRAPDFRLLSRIIPVPSSPAMPSPSTRPVHRAETPKTPGQTTRDDGKTAEEDRGGFDVFMDSPDNVFVTRSDPRPPRLRPRQVNSALEEKSPDTRVV